MTNPNRRERWEREKWRNRSPEAAKEVLAMALRKAGWDREIARYSFVLHWAAIVGEKLARCTKPSCIKGDCLVITVPNSAMAQELTMHKQTILRRLRSYLHRDDTVTRIQVTVGA